MLQDGVLVMADMSTSNYGEERRPVLTETVVHIVVPENRLFMCGSEPPSVPAMLEAMKLFIQEASTAIFKLEIEKII